MAENGVYATGGASPGQVVKANASNDMQGLIRSVVNSNAQAQGRSTKTIPGNGPLGQYMEREAAGLVEAEQRKAAGKPGGAASSGHKAGDPGGVLAAAAGDLLEGAGAAPKGVSGATAGGAGGGGAGATRSAGGGSGATAKGGIGAAVNSGFNQVGKLISNMAQMALGTGGTNKLWWPEMCMIGLVPVNIVKVQTPTHDATVTKYALENGEPVADHVLRDPFKVTIRGKWASDAGLHHVYYHALEFIHQRRLLIPFLSNMQIRKNMIVAHLAVSHQQHEANVFSFDCTLQQVSFAKAGSAEIWEPAEDPATGTTPEGGSGSGSTGSVQQDDGSLLQGLAGMVSKLWDQYVGGKE